MHLEFRPATPADGSILLSIHRRAVTELVAKDYTTDEIRSWLHGLTPEGYGRSMDEGERIEMAMVDGCLVGFCGNMPCAIRGLFVDPDYTRRAGLGSALLQRALQVLRSDGCARAAVISSMTATPFYIRNGFEELGRREHKNRGVVSKWKSSIWRLISARISHRALAGGRHSSSARKLERGRGGSSSAMRSFVHHMLLQRPRARLRICQCNPRRSARPLRAIRVAMREDARLLAACVEARQSTRGIAVMGFWRQDLRATQGAAEVPNTLDGQPTKGARHFLDRGISLGKEGSSVLRPLPRYRA